MANSGKYGNKESIMDTVLKILHLEDNILDSELIKRILKNSKIDFTYLLVDNKEDFTNALTSFSPDIILSDHTLPAFISKEALEIVNAHPVKIPFILVTGTVSEEYAVEIMKGGAYDYLLKDHLQRLPAAVLNAVEKCRIENENQKYFEKLVTNEALLREAERLAHLGSWQFNMETSETKWSDEAFRILGLEPGEVAPSQQVLYDCVHPDDIEYVKAMTADSMVLFHNNIKFNFRIITKDKQIRYILNEMRVDRDETGRPIKLLGFNLDITDFQKSQDALIKSEANLRTIFDNTDISYLLLDAYLNIVSFNKLAKDGFFEQMGKPLIEGRNMLDYVSADKKKEYNKKYRTVLKGKSLDYDACIERADNTAYWYRMRMSPVFQGEGAIIGMVMAVTDITQRKKEELEKEKLAEELKISHISLKKLVTRVQAAREEERLHIAREVHDELGQVLTATKIEVAMLHKKIPGRIENVFLHKEFLNIIKLIDNAIASVKKIATDLRPEMLDELGLVESIKWQVGEFKANTGIECSLILSNGFVKLPLDINVSTTLYRIVQESLTNISRHAQATRVKIALKTNEESLFLVIQDNGIGITEDQKNRKKSFGLTGIRERVVLLNGNMEISGQPGNGTIVYIQIPYKND
jgi:PAS domain S-box-containing protein